MIEDDVRIDNCEYCGDLVAEYKGVRANHECDETAVFERIYNIWDELEKLMGDDYGKWRANMLGRSINWNGYIDLKVVVRAANEQLCKLRKQVSHETVEKTGRSGNDTF